MLRRFYSVARNLKPTEQVPDVQTFLSKIGRNMTQYAEGFESWDQFISSSSKQLAEKGLDTRDRRYLLNWFDKYGRGVELHEYKRGKKQWGGERKRNGERAAFYGRKAAEARENA